MSDLKNWADNAELNVDNSPNGWPEGMPPSAVNNSAREMMAALRRSYVRQPWFAPGGAIVRASTSQITIADDAKVTNYSNYYTVGARVRIETTGDYVLGRVVESQYEAPTSTITFALDSSADLPSTITDVYVGLSPEDITGIAGPNLLGCVIGFTEEGTKVGSGLLLANGSKFNPSIYPDLAQLYYVSENTYRYGQELVGDVYWPKLPDVRGYFPRYADDRTAPSEGEEDTRIDPSAPRTVGSTQGDAIRNMTGETLTGAEYFEQGGTSGVFYKRSLYAAKNRSADVGDGMLIGIDASLQVPTAEEDRPKNMALVGVVVAYSGVISAGLADVTELETYCTAERERAESAADRASTSADNADLDAGTASSSAVSAGNSATLAQQWAVKMDGQVASTDYSSKYYADLAHKWATSSTVVESGQYGASYYALRAYNYANAAETARDTAKDWATKTDGAVSGSDYSAKYYANSAVTSATNASNSATLAQQWAIKTDGAVSGTSYSAKYYAEAAATSATQAADIVASIGPVMRYRGSVATYADLPTATAVTGDVYNVTVDGKNYAFTAGGTWDDFGGAITVSIAACTDVSLTSLTNGDVLIYNSSTQKWENGTVRTTFRGAYDATTQYRTGDIVQGDTNPKVFYQAVQDSLAVYLNDTNYWSLLSNDNTVHYVEATGDDDYPIGGVSPSASGSSYGGAMYFTLQSGPKFNASTGILTAPGLKTTTQAQGDNSTNAATTEYVDTAVAGAGFLTNTATTQNNSLSILGTSTSSTGYSTAIGVSSTTSSKTRNVAVGYGAKASGEKSIFVGAIEPGQTTLGATARGAIAIGYNASAIAEYAISIGTTTVAGVGAKGTNSIAIGRDAYVYASGVSSIQLGYGTNTDSKTFKVGFYDDTTPTNYTLLDGTTGNIPEARLGNTLITGASDPTTSTVGVLGRFYKNTTSGAIFKCTAIDNTDPNAVVYTWSELLDTSMNYIKNLSTAATTVSIVPGGSPSSNLNAVCIGSSGAAANYSVAVGNNAKTTSNGVAVGLSANVGGSSTHGVAIGSNAKVIAGSTRAISIGAGAETTGQAAIQLGYGFNTTAKTFNVGFYDASTPTNWQLLDGATGTIPGPRMALQAAGAPTTATVGTVGQFYVDTTNQDAYICVSDASSTYTWKKITP